MMQQEDGLLVSYVAGKLIDVIATINQNPNITPHIAEVCFGCDDSLQTFGSCTAHITLLAGILYFD